MSCSEGFDCPCDETDPTWLAQYREWAARQPDEIEPTEVEREFIAKLPGWKPKR